MSAYPGSAVDPIAVDQTTPIFNLPCATSVIDAPFKVDEGYSEETRSQEDGDSAMGMEMSANNLNVLSVGLPDVILTLSEAERSGKMLTGFLAGVNMLTKHVRVYIQPLAHSQDFFDCYDSRTLAAPPTHQSHISTSPRVDLSDLLLPCASNVIGGLQRVERVARENSRE